MSILLKHQQVAIGSPWQVLTLAEGETPESVALPSTPTIYPLAVWQARKAELQARGAQVGVWLEPADDPASLAAELANFAVIAVNFPKFTDGRGFSTARLLRERYGFGGELRAIGDVLVDQLFFLARVGFTTFALRADQNVDDAIKAFSTFSESYQTGVDQTQPLFRRRVA